MEHDFIGYDPNSTAGRVLIALRDQEFMRPDTEPQWTESNENHDEGWVIRFNAPWRERADSFSCALTIHDDMGEMGTFYDHVDESSGSLYQLAAKLGLVIEPPAKSGAKAYRDLREYAEERGIPIEWFQKAGWSDGERFCSVQQKPRPCLFIKSDTGTRVRFIDGLKPKFGSPKEYHPCWYGLKRAVDIASRNGKPLVLTNGESSTIVAHYWGIPAFALAGGSEKRTMRRADFQLLKQAYPEGEIWVAYDSDKHGRHKAPAQVAQLVREGYDSLAVDFGGNMVGFDLGNFCALHREESWAYLALLAANSKDMITANAPEVKQELLDNASLLSPIHIERATLAVLMFYPSLIATLGSRWSDQWYSNEAHQLLARILTKMNASGEVIDHRTVWQKVSEQGKQALYGSEAGVAAWRNEGLDKDSLDSYLGIVRDATIRRQWLHATFAMQRAARDPSVPVGELKNHAELAIVATESGRTKQTKRTFSMTEASDHAMANYMSPVAVLKTLIAPLDQYLDGVAEGDVVTMAGRPGGGKTALALAMLANYALQDVPCHFFSQEVPVDQLIARLVAYAIRNPMFHRRFPELRECISIPYSAIIKRRLQPNEMAGWGVAMEAIKTLPFTITYGRSTLRDIWHEAEKLAEQCGDKVVVCVDYLQFMQAPIKAASTIEAISENMQGLKELADQEWTHHVVCLSQMNRSIEHRDGNESRMSDSEGSGKIEQTSVTMLNFLPMATSTDTIQKLWVDGVKSRNGAIGKFQLGYEKATNFFTALHS